TSLPPAVAKRCASVSAGAYTIPEGPRRRVSRRDCTSSVNRPPEPQLRPKYHARYQHAPPGLVRKLARNPAIRVPDALVRLYPTGDSSSCPRRLRIQTSRERSIGCQARVKRGAPGLQPKMT